MIKDGIKVIVPFSRDDIYGNELYNSTKLNFIKLGGKVEDGITYRASYRQVCYKFTQNKFYYVGPTS